MGCHSPIGREVSRVAQRSGTASRSVNLVMKVRILSCKGCSNRRGAKRITSVLLCARHGRNLGGESPLRGVVPLTVSRRQGRHREVGSGGSRRQNLGPRNTNLVIRPCSPDERATSREVHGTKGLRGARGGREGKDCVLTRGDLPAVG